MHLWTLLLLDHRAAAAQFHIIRSRCFQLLIREVGLSSIKGKCVWIFRFPQTRWGGLLWPQQLDCWFLPTNSTINVDLQLFRFIHFFWSLFISTFPIRLDLQKVFVAKPFYLGIKRCKSKIQTRLTNMINFRKISKHIWEYEIWNSHGITRNLCFRKKQLTKIIKITLVLLLMEKILHQLIW